jgi:nucleosome binding factor SPN SPT16 subunit
VPGPERQLSPLSAAQQGRAYTLPDVWIRPPLGGKGRKMTGQLEAHANGFRYLGPKGEVLDIMYRCVLATFMASLQCGLACFHPQPM